MTYALNAQAVMAPVTNEGIQRQSDQYVSELPTIAPSPYDPCSCVSYAKAKTGQTEVWGQPNRLTPKTQVPQVGLVVLLNEGPFGHAAVVVSVSDTTIKITEANYIRCKVGTRTLLRADPRIRGYY